MMPGSADYPIIVDKYIDQWWGVFVCVCNTILMTSQLCVCCFTHATIDNGCRRHVFFILYSYNSVPNDSFDDFPLFIGRRRMYVLENTLLFTLLFNKQIQRIH